MCDKFFFSKKQLPQNGENLPTKGPRYFELMFNYITGAPTMN
jgi:hypothetical protein